ncbi:MAG: 4-hydroxy-tetrahydrodipicolinate synthase [Candidatus Bathyarchaeota archaeon]|nr:4-hydroxy-tetrahydrodipicolinate synthase [Candidatus Bathyarchaeota archaeon]
MSGFKLEGVLPAIVTPFDKHEEFNEEAFRTLIDWLIEQGITGIVPCGTTGEFSLMTQPERAKVIEACVDQVNGRIPVIAGTGDTATKLVINATKHALDVGADAAIIVNPYYMKPKGGKGIYDHYINIASAVDIPMIIYNIPVATNQYIPWQVVEDLVDELDTVKGMKDSSGDLKYFMTILEKVGEKIDVVIGWDEVVLPALAAGAKGMILASANVIAPNWLNIYHKMKKGKYEEARTAQKKLQKLTRHMVATGALGPKLCLNYLGHNVGMTRRPIILGDTVSWELQEEFRVELEKLGMLKKKPIEFKLPEKPVTTRFNRVDITPEVIKQFKLRTGEALVDPNSNEVAHIDLLIGVIDGPVGNAYANALARPSKGREALQVILEPNLAVKPPTIMVPTVPVKGMRDASLVYGPAQEAVAKAIVQCVTDGILPETDELVMIANVFVHPSASRRKRVYINNYKAMRHAIRKAVEGRPSFDELKKNKDNARHPLRESQ